jgi:hypothetical protein
VSMKGPLPIVRVPLGGFVTLEVKVVSSPQEASGLERELGEEVPFPALVCSLRSAGRVAWFKVVGGSSTPPFRLPRA